MPELSQATASGLPTIRFEPINPSSYINPSWLPEPLPPDLRGTYKTLGHAGVLGEVSKTIAALPDAFEKSYKQGQERAIDTAETKGKLAGLQLKSDILANGLSPDRAAALQGVAIGPDGSTSYHPPGLYDLDFQKAKLDDTRAQIAQRNSIAEKNRMMGGLVPNSLYGDIVPTTSGGLIPPEQGEDLSDIVKKFEGFNPNAYNDHHQVSIGYGTKARPGETSIDEREASVRLNHELNQSAASVDSAIEKLGVKLSSNQRNALISFDYNTGAGANVLLKTGGDPAALAKEMASYTHVTDSSGAKVHSRGLADRRKQEIAMLIPPSAVPLAMGAAKEQNVAQPMAALRLRPDSADAIPGLPVSFSLTDSRSNPAVQASQINDLKKDIGILMADHPSVENERQLNELRAELSKLENASGFSIQNNYSNNAPSMLLDTSDITGQSAAVAIPAIPAATSSVDPAESVAKATDGTPVTDVGRFGGKVTVHGTGPSAMIREETPDAIYISPAMHKPGIAPPIRVIKKPAATDKPGMRQYTEMSQWGVTPWNGMTKADAADAIMQARDEMGIERSMPPAVQKNYDLVRAELARNPIIKQSGIQNMGYASIKAGHDQKSGFGDIMMIDGFMKLVNPSMGVTGQAVSSMQDALPLLDRWSPLPGGLPWGKFLEGDKFTEEGRQKLMAAADAKHALALGQMRKVLGGYSQLAQQKGIPPEKLETMAKQAYLMGDEAPAAGAAPNQPAPTSTPSAPAAPIAAMVRMLKPDGTAIRVPANQVEAAKQLGATIAP